MKLLMTHRKCMVCGNESKNLNQCNCNCGAYMYLIGHPDVPVIRKRNIKAATSNR